MTRRNNALARAGERGALTFLGFKVGELSYAVEIACVREIIRPVPTLPLPHVPSSIVGVVDHRGDVLPVVDLRVRFGVDREAAEPRQVRWIVANRIGQLVGLVVDSVTEVFACAPDERRAVPSIAEGEELRGIVGAYSHAGALVFQLDVEQLTQVVEGLDPELAARAVRASEPG
jgi:purine-binding chemotaxis protein CheW